MYAGRGAIFREASLPAGRKIVSLRDPRPEDAEGKLQWIAAGVAVAWEAFPRPHAPPQRSIASSLFFAISIPVMGLRPVTGVLPASLPAPIICGTPPPF